jgi:hypothetical protein
MLLISMLRSSQGFWEVVEYAGEVLVLVGVILEDIAENRKEKKPLKAVIVGRSDGPQTEISLSTKEDEVRRKRQIKRATRVLFVGLMVALVGIVRANQVSDERIAALNAKAGEAWQHANDLAKQSDGFKLEIAKANERAADSNKLASLATTRAADLQSQLDEYRNTEFLKSLPRTISMDIPKLKKFGRQRIDVIVVDAQYESRQFASEILFGCRELNWECKLWQVKPGLSSEIYPLTTVCVMEGSDVNTKSVADELFKELFTAEFRWGRNPPQVPPPIVVPFGRDGSITMALTLGPVAVDPVPSDGGKWHDKSAAPIRIIIAQKASTYW